jgi:hypothetical protein
MQNPRAGGEGLGGEACSCRLSLCRGSKDISLGIRDKKSGAPWATPLFGEEIYDLCVEEFGVILVCHAIGVEEGDDVVH